MQLVKLIIPKRIKTLYCFFGTLLVFIFAGFSPVSAQDNSPYSRYGIGDLVPSTHTISRAMGGVSAGYADFLSINFNNPASYASFDALQETKGKKLTYGRAILDIGINLENRVLRESNPVKKFTASNLLVSYLQVGVPIKKGWGLNFGIRPISRVSYKIFRGERLKDPITGLPIDTATTRFEGDGGSYLASAGTGINIFRKTRYASKDKKQVIGEESLSFGINAGYLFGEKDINSRREFRNDTVQYYSANFESKTNYGNLYFNAGLQYRLPLDEGRKIFSFGMFGSWKQSLNARQDRVRETFIYDANFGDLRLDSIQDIRDVKGKILMPANFTAGFVLQKIPLYKKNGGWLIGADINFQNWENFRFYDQKDSVTNKTEIRIGAQIYPKPGDNYFSNLSYRFGLIFGPDYIHVQNKKLNQFGFTMGLGVPVANHGRFSKQFTMINLAFEVLKRGNSSNLLRENLFRLSAGFSLSDIWFEKRKYD